MNSTIYYTIQIKVDGNWEFYKRTTDEHTKNCITNAFGKLARVSVFKL